MAICTKCGAALQEGTRFCTQCGTASARKDAPEAGHRERPTLSGKWKARLSAAALALAVLAAAWGAFALVTAPRQDSPAGVLALLVSGAARGDTDQVADCMGLDAESRADLRANAGAYGQGELLLALAAQFGDAGMDSLEALREGVRAEVLSVSYTYTDGTGNACAVEALLRVTPQGGEPMNVALHGLPMVRSGGTWRLGQA